MFPTQNSEGIECTVFNHFGSAPSFVVANVETKEVTDRRIQSIKALSGESVDAIVVGVLCWRVK